MIENHQYYYRTSGCPAQSGYDSDCVCWHSEGDGPFENERHDDETKTVSWRTVPDEQK